MSSPTEIPVIDFNNFPTRYEVIAEQVFNACKNVGFFFQMINYLEPSVSQVQQVFNLVCIVDIFIFVFGISMG